MFFNGIWIYCFEKVFLSSLSMFFYVWLAFNLHQLILDVDGHLDLVPDEDMLTVDPNDPDKDIEETNSDDDDDFVW